MKKLILFCFTTFAFAGCDYQCSFDYVIVNQTESDIVFIVKHDTEHPTTITPDNKHIYGELTRCGARGKLSDPYLGDREHEILFSADMTINGQLIPETIWKRKYWEFASNEVRHGIYTIIVTNDLLQGLETDNI